MRQGQQNRRGRGRHSGGGGGGNNNNRKHQNPLTRTFDSNGPDQKIRGTPAHIAEKYVSLARDALSAGDPVLAENYLQHAEHYNRIIMGYREQQAELQQQQQQQPRVRQNDESGYGEAGDNPPHDSHQRMNGSHEPNGHANGRANGNGSSPPRGYDEPESPEGRRSEGPRDEAMASEQSDTETDAPAPKQPRTRQPRTRRAPRPTRSKADTGDGDQQPDFLTRPIRRPKRTTSSDAPESGRDNNEAVVATADESAAE